MTEPLDSSKWSTSWGLSPSTPPPPTPAPTAPAPKGAGRPKRRVGWIAGVLVAAIAAGIVFVVVSGNDKGSALSAPEWAKRYCDVVSPYGPEATTLVGQVTAGLGAPGGGAKAKSEMLQLGRLLDDVLVRIDTLATDHPISGEGGTQLTSDLRVALGRTRGILGDAVTQIRGLDPATGDFQTRALSVLTSAGVSFDTRIATPASPALNRLNVAIEQNGACQNFFSPN